jgi:hypothetical protein
MIPAVAASLLVLAAAPGIGQMRALIQDAFPGHYRLILVSIVAVALAVAVLVAATTIRERRRLRYGLIAAAIAIGTAYSLLTATGVPDVDAVERFHFIEYGLLTLLFFRVWRGLPWRAAAVLSFTSVLLVGTFDEWIQWFVPDRVGEWRDVLLNSVAIGSGLLFALGLQGPATTSYYAYRVRSGRFHPALLPLLTLATFAAFFYTVHVGYEIRDAAIGTFRSRFSAAELLALVDQRRDAWRVSPPSTMRTYSREDQYLAEALWHVQRRNDMEGAGGIWATWKENLILEKYFAPVLEFPTYRTPGGARWPPEQRAHVEAAAAADSRPFVSDAHPFPIYAWLGR